MVRRIDLGLVGARCLLVASMALAVACASEGPPSASSESSTVTLTATASGTSGTTGNTSQGTDSADSEARTSYDLPKFDVAPPDGGPLIEDEGGCTKVDFLFIIDSSNSMATNQAELVASHIAKQDIVITTALIPGRPAPRLITKAMVESMRPGSVIIDIAAGNGGNCELSEPDKVVEHNGVKIAGFTNLPARLAADSSQLLAKNLVNLFPLLVGEDGGFAPHWEDEVIVGMALTKDGAVKFSELPRDVAVAGA